LSVFFGGLPAGWGQIEDVWYLEELSENFGVLTSCKMWISEFFLPTCWFYFSWSLGIVIITPALSFDKYLSRNCSSSSKVIKWLLPPPQMLFFESGLRIHQMS
jgi:hypothetical protein